MSAVVQISENRLVAIPQEIARHAAKVVEGAWSIGSLLNEAKALHVGDDAAFGAWRRSNVTQALGIADRTQRTFMRIARVFTAEQLPHYLGITALADAASLADNQRDELMTYFESVATEGKRLPLSTTTMATKLAREGARADELGHRLNPERIKDVVEVPQELRPGAAAVAAEAAPVIDGKFEREEPNIPAPRDQRQAAAAPAAEIDEVAEWAKELRRALKGKSAAKRLDFVSAMMQELREAGIVEKGDDVVMVPNKKVGRYQIVTADSC